MAHLKKLYSEYSHPPHPLSAAGKYHEENLGMPFPHFLHKENLCASVQIPTTSLEYEDDCYVDGEAKMMIRSPNNATEGIRAVESDFGKSNKSRIPKSF